MLRDDLNAADRVVLLYLLDLQRFDFQAHGIADAALEEAWSAALVAPTPRLHVMRAEFLALRDRPAEARVRMDKALEHPMPEALATYARTLQIRWAAS